MTLTSSTPSLSSRARSRGCADPVAPLAPEDPLAAEEPLAPEPTSSAAARDLLTDGEVDRCDGPCDGRRQGGIGERVWADVNCDWAEVTDASSESIVAADALADSSADSFASALASVACAASRSACRRWSTPSPVPGRRHDVTHLHVHRRHLTGHPEVEVGLLRRLDRPLAETVCLMVPVVTLTVW